MKKFPWKQTLAAGVLIIASGLYVWHLNSDASEVPPPANPDADGNTQPTGSTSTTTPTSGAYTDGNYTGTVADAFYGNLQVQASISGGKIVSVKFLQYPNNQPHSLQVSQTAMPVLQSEAIQAQSAKVDIVSGATQTSEAFQQSLASALTQAQQP